MYLRYPLRRKLAENFTWQRMLMSIICLSGFLLHSLFGEFAFLGHPALALGTLPKDSRVLIYAFGAYSTCILIAASFPVNPSTEAGAKFCAAPVLVGSVLRCCGVALDVYHTGHFDAYACTLVHRLANAAVFGLWLHYLWLGVTHRVSWRAGRFTHFGEGLMFVLCALLLRVLGPTPHYAPGRMSYPAALARGGLAMLLGGVVLTPRNRMRIARLANTLGWNHVVFSLGELRTPELTAADGDGAHRANECTADDDATSTSEYMSWTEMQGELRTR